MADYRQTNAFRLIHALDFARLPVADLNSDGIHTIGGVDYTVGNSASLTSLDLDGSTGLVAVHNIADTTGTGRVQTMTAPFLRIPSLQTAFGLGDVSEVLIKLQIDVSDADTNGEYAGYGMQDIANNAYGTSGALGHDGATYRGKFSNDATAGVTNIGVSPETRNVLMGRHWPLSCVYFYDDFGSSFAPLREATYSDHSSRNANPGAAGVEFGAEQSFWLFLETNNVVGGFTVIFQKMEIWVNSAGVLP